MRTIARMADFLRGMVGVLAAVVIERFDQRRPRRHGMFAGQRIIGEADQVMRAVEQPLGDQMRHLFRTALDIALDQNEAGAHDLLAEALHHLRPHHDIGDAGFVLERHEDDALGAAGTLPHQHHAGTTDPAPVLVVTDVLAGHDAFARKHRPQELHRVALQRQPDGLIIGDHLLRQRHQRQRPGILVRLLARRGNLEQRQRHVIRQAAHRPQRGAAVKPDGAERVGIRQQDQGALGQAGVAGEIFQRGEGPAGARRDDALGPIVTTVIPGRRVSDEPGISRFRVCAGGASRNDDGISAAPHPDRSI